MYKFLFVVSFLFVIGCSDKALKRSADIVLFPDYQPRTDYSQYDVHNIDLVAADVENVDIRNSNIDFELTDLQPDMILVDVYSDISEDVNSDIFEVVNMEPDVVTNDIFNTQNINRNFIVWLPFNEDTLDYSGNEHHGQNNGCEFTDNRNNDLTDKAAIFHFIEQDSVIILDNDDLSFADDTHDQAFSIAAWVNVNRVALFYIVVKGHENDNTLEYELFIDEDEKLIYRLCNRNNTDCITAKTVDTYSQQARWTHVVAVYDGSRKSSGISLYINAVEADLVDAETEEYSGMVNESGSITVAKKGEVYSGGIIDDFRIYDRYLFEPEIWGLYVEEKVIIPVMDAGEVAFDAGVDQGEDECIFHSDCPGNSYCLNGECIIDDCETDYDCFEHYICTEHGECEPGYNCQISFDYNQNSSNLTLTIEGDITSALVEQVDEERFTKVRVERFDVSQYEQDYQGAGRYNFSISIEQNDQFYGAVYVDDRFMYSYLVDLNRCEVIPNDFMSIKGTEWVLKFDVADL